MDASDIDGALADSNLATITTASKVSGSAVQLQSNKGISDSTGLGLVLESNKGLSVGASGLAIDLSANGGVVFKGGKLAVKLDASDIDGALADSNIATITTTDKVSGSACLLYTSPSPRDATLSRMPSSA